jgi:hypothetical protein
MIFPKHRNREFSDGKQGIRVADQGTILPVYRRFKSGAGFVQDPTKTELRKAI